MNNTVIITLTKAKISQACERSDLSWNRPRKTVIIFLWCWKYDRSRKQCSISERWKLTIFTINHLNRARLCTRFCTTLTKAKISQACERSYLSWNRPSKYVVICILCCWKYDRRGKQCSIGERWKLTIFTINLLKRARLCTHFSTILTKVKISQACEISYLSWNRPRKTGCIFLRCWKYDRSRKQYSISEKWKLTIFTINHLNRARLCTCFCTILTKVKISQACERSDLTWNRPKNRVYSCIFCGVGNTV